MLELEYGIVRHFNNRPGKRSGLLAVIDEAGNFTGEDIFFHANDGQWVEIVGDDIEFVGRNFPDGGAPVYTPSVGNKLAFDRAPGSEGREMASPWTYAEVFDSRVKQLSEPYYRLVMVVVDADGTENKRVLRECKGSDALSREYPLRVISDVLLDPLAPKVDPNTFAKTSYVFEMRVEPDDVEVPNDLPAIWTVSHWRKCDDPRYRSPAVCELDAARAAS